MKHWAILSVLIFLLDACAPNNTKTETAPKVQEVKNVKNAIVGIKTRVNYDPGSPTGMETPSYFLVYGKDTSNFCCNIYGAKNGKFWLELYTPYTDTSLTYRHTLRELRMILQRVSKDYSMDSLVSVHMERFIKTGDLTVDVTKHYFREFGKVKEIKNDARFNDFLLKSKLGIDLDDVFKPYNLAVDNFFIEKAFFSPKAQFLWASKIECDTADVPERVMDILYCIAKLKKG